MKAAGMVGFLSFYRKEAIPDIPIRLGIPLHGEGRITGRRFTFQSLPFNHINSYIIKLQLLTEARAALSSDLI